MEEAFRSYVDAIGSALGHADRRSPLGEYLTGLLLPLERKSVEPMAAALEPKRTGVAHQRMHHFVATSGWSDDRLGQAVREWAIPQMLLHDPLTVWIVDDTGFPKKGKHSVGVARQYCGQLGKQDNCQVAVSLSIAGDRASLPVGYRLYLPKQWAEDPVRRKRTGVPEAIRFQTKPQIALDLVGQAIEKGVPEGVVLADAGYGNDTGFRDDLTELQVPYAVGIQTNTTVWAPGTKPAALPSYGGKGRPRKLLRRTDGHAPVTVSDLAKALSSQKWKTIAWREGVRENLESRFARVRVRAAHRDYWRRSLRPEEWLVMEWPRGESEPTKYWLSTMGKGVSFTEMVGTIKMRWRIEMDYRDMKQHLGFDSYEGRSWGGLHRHLAMVFLMHTFIALHRERFSPRSPTALDLEPVLSSTEARHRSLA